MSARESQQIRLRSRAFSWQKLLSRPMRAAMRHTSTSAASTGRQVSQKPIRQGQNSQATSGNSRTSSSPRAGTRRPPSAAPRQQTQHHNSPQGQRQFLLSHCRTSIPDVFKDSIQEENIKVNKNILIFDKLVDRT